MVEFREFQPFLEGLHGISKFITREVRKGFFRGVRGRRCCRFLALQEGDDRIYGQEGDDYLSGWTGNDTLDGGSEFG